MTPAGVANALLTEERWRQVLSSLVVCFFARGLYTPALVLRALACAHLDRTEEDLHRVGAETLRRKQAFKIREGFDPAKLRIPARVMETPVSPGDNR